MSKIFGTAVMYVTMHCCKLKTLRIKTCFPVAWTGLKFLRIGEYKLLIKLNSCVLAHMKFLLSFIFHNTYFT